MIIPRNKNNFGVLDAINDLKDLGTLLWKFRSFVIGLTISTPWLPSHNVRHVINAAIRSESAAIVFVGFKPTASGMIAPSAT